MKSFFTILIILFTVTNISSFVKDTVRINQVVTVDGDLQEEFWKRITPVTQFTQRDPDEGKEPTERTEVKIAYDDAALYIGARMHDSYPDSIIARLARKDVDVTSDLRSE